METVGAFEAKTHLAELLDRGQQGGDDDDHAAWRARSGGRVRIAAVGKGSSPHQDVVDGMRALRRRVKPDSMSVREMVEAGGGRF